MFYKLITVVAALAVSAVTASGAMAAEFHSGQAHTIYSGGQTTTHKFTVGAGFGVINCTAATFIGTGTATTASQLTLRPEYSGCKDSFGRVVDLSLNGCQWTLNTSTGTLSFVGCMLGFGTHLAVTGSGGSVDCEIDIKEQTGINGQSFSTGSSGGASDLTITSAASNIKSTVTNTGGLGCGTTSGEKTGGTYTGTTTISGVSTAGTLTNISYS